MAEKTNEVQSNGNVQISDEVIAVVSSVASMEIEGVIGMASSFSSGIAELMGKKTYSKGVKSAIEGNDAKIVVSIIVKYGCKIQEVAWKVQQNVKEAVENMTGLNVTAVDVCVVGIENQPEKPAEKTEE